MMEKRSSDLAKDNLAPILDFYIKLLTDGLVSDGIIGSRLSNSNDDELGSVEQTTQGTLNLFSNERDVVIKMFLDFKTIVLNVYANLEGVNFPDVERIPLTDIIQYFEDLNVFKIRPGEVAFFKYVLNKGELLQDDDIKNEAIEYFGKSNINFLDYTHDLFVYFISTKATQELPDFYFEFGDGSLSSGTVVGKNYDANRGSIIMHVKYRRRILDTLKDDLIAIHENLASYNLKTGTDNYGVLILFTSEAPMVFDKMLLRFDQSLQELFPNFEDRIMLMPVNFSSLHGVKDGFVKVQNRLFIGNTKAAFKLFSQPISDDSPELDDHYHSEAFSLDKAHYEILIRPEKDFDHWRCGLKFSRKRESNFVKRHEADHPIIHIEKNKDSRNLLVSYYDFTGNQNYAASTTLNEYSTQPVLFRIYSRRNETYVDILDQTRKSIFEGPQIISDVNFFHLFAWADGRNRFDVQINVMKIVRSLTNEAGVAKFSVRNKTGAPIANAQVLLLAENNTYLEKRTLANGTIDFEIRAKKKYLVLVAHENYQSTIIDDADMENETVVELAANNSIGSIICANGTGYIPSIEGRINPIFDSSKRTYLYANNIAINGGKTQPFHFELNHSIDIEDKNGTQAEIMIKFIRGRTTLIDYRITKR